MSNGQTRYKTGFEPAPFRQAENSDRLNYEVTLLYGIIQETYERVINRKE